MTETNTQPQKGIYVNNFVVATFAILFAVLSIATGFFSSYFFKLKTSGTAVPNTNQAAKVVAPEEVYKKVRKVESNEHIRGNPNAKVVLVEYTDFQCPYCATFHKVGEEFIKKYPDYGWVLRDLPLSFHPEAFNRAEYAECVAKNNGEDSYWKYVDQMYAQEDLNNVDVDKLVTNLGLDLQKIKDCITAGDFKAKITNEQEEGITLLTELDSEGRYGTPGNILINTETKKGVKLRGAVPLTEIESQLKTIEK